MPILYPSTVEYMKFCVNLVLRGLTFSASAGIMAGVSIPLKWFLDYLMAVFGVAERVQEIVSQIAIGFPIVFALAILYVGVMDIITLTIASVERPRNIRGERDDERSRDRR